MKKLNKIHDITIDGSLLVFLNFPLCVAPNRSLIRDFPRPLFPPLPFLPIISD